MVYKIGVISTHRTGKSKLVEGVVENLGILGINIKKIEEAADIAYKKGLPIGSQTTPGSQIYIFATQVTSELEPSESTLPVNYEVIICDRGLNDNLVYLERIVKKAFDAQKAEKIVKTFTNLTSICLEHFPYQTLYLLPIIKGTTLEDNERVNLRPEDDPEFQKGIYLRLKESLQEFNIKYIELPHPEEQDKFRDVWKVIVTEHTLLNLGKKEAYSKWGLMKKIRDWEKKIDFIKTIDSKLYSEWESMKKKNNWDNPF